MAIVHGNRIDKLLDLTVGLAADGNSADQVNYNCRGVVLFIKTANVAGGFSCVFTIEGKDPVSGTYYTILASAAVTTNALTILRVYPGLTASANAIASDVLPHNYRVKWHPTAGSADVSVTAALEV